MLFVASLLVATLLVAALLVAALLVAVVNNGRRRYSIIGHGATIFDGFIEGRVLR